MIILIKSQDREKGIKRLISLRDGLLKKRKDSQFIELEEDGFSEDRIRELVSGSDLFAQKFIVSSKYLFSKKDFSETLVKYLKEISKSENVFIFLEGDLGKSLEKKIEKYAEKVEEISSIKKEEKEFKPFSLTDAVGERNKQKAWKEYHVALQNNQTPEEITGLIFWQIKSLLLAGEEKDAKSAGLNPFVFRKAKNYSKNFSKKEILNLLTKVTNIYHNSRRGGVEINLELERFLLSL